MFSYFKNKILSSKVEENSPTKTGSHLNSRENIYLEQVQNYIDIEGGYQVLKEKLFKDINANYCYDSPFIQELVILLRKSLTVLNPFKANRVLDVIEDLIGSCGSVINETLNNREFCVQLENCALVLHHASIEVKQWSIVRRRAGGILQYLSKKFEDQSENVFKQSIRSLQQKKVQLPGQPTIEESKPLPKTPEITAHQSGTRNEILKACTEFTEDAEQNVRFHPQVVDTNYVRLIKSHAKRLYDMSTDEGSNLEPAEKTKIGGLYKRLRTLLKQIEKKNSEQVAQKAINDEKKFLQEKAEKFSPKKVSATEKVNQDIDLLGEQGQPKQRQIQTQEEIARIAAQSIDADIIEQAVQQQQQGFSTPKKAQKKEEEDENEGEDLLAMDESPSHLIFKKMYSDAESSKQLEGIDLSKSPSVPAPQDDEEEEFGDFQSPS